MAPSKFSEFVKGLQAMYMVVNKTGDDWEVSFRIGNIKKIKYGRDHKTNDTVINIGVFTNEVTHELNATLTMSKGFGDFYTIGWEDNDLIPGSPSFVKAFKDPANKDVLKKFYSVLSYKKAEVWYGIDEMMPGMGWNRDNAEAKVELTRHIEGLLRIARPAETSLPLVDKPSNMDKLIRTLQSVDEYEYADP